MSAATVASWLLGLAAVTALGVVVAGAAPARDWLGFTFPTLPATGAEVASILVNNLRMLAAVFLGCCAAQLALDAHGQLWVSGMALVCDAAVLIVSAGHAMLIGAGVGAHGGRMVAALLPHGPVELVAYSLALGLYATSRKERIPRRWWATVGCVCVALLAIAAPLEVFVVP